MLYRYHVSAIPEDWADGRVFDNHKDAEEHAQSIGGCVTEVSYELSDSELVWDGRDACECNRSCVCE